MGNDAAAQELDLVIRNDTVVTADAEFAADVKALR